MSGMRISEMTEMLVPLDGRETSLRSMPVAGRIAARLGMGMRLFGVSDDREETESWLRAQANRLLPGRDVAVEAAPGDPAEAIVARAGEESLVCMATAATLRPHQGHIGSVAEGVVRGLGRPVMLIGPEVDLDPGQPTERVILPVDGSDFSEQSAGVAGDLAKALGVPVWVVAAVPQKAEAAAGAELGEVPYIAESGYVRHVAKSLEKKHGIEAEYEVLHITDPARAILDFAGDDGTVVMATHGRSGLSRVFAGSVAVGVVAHSKRPVVVWRPSEE